MTDSRRTGALCLVATLFFYLSYWASATAQNHGCVLVRDDQNPSEKILRCGDYLTIRSAAATQYRLVDQTKNPPDSAQLDSGALMIEFKGSTGLHDFQILTPLAIASVRGTKWIVTTQGAQTSTFVISGKVSVTRRNNHQSADLGPGEGTDIDAGSGPVIVKRWPAARVKALLARFGQ
jgi:ferric-dicitrate binding protein FerR (iron transport regulator)